MGKLNQKNVQYLLKREKTVFFCDLFLQLAKTIIGMTLGIVKQIILGIWNNLSILVSEKGVGISGEA